MQFETTGERSRGHQKWPKCPWGRKKLRRQYPEKHYWHRAMVTTDV